MHHLSKVYPNNIESMLYIKGYLSSYGTYGTFVALEYAIYVY